MSPENETKPNEAESKVAELQTKLEEATKKAMMSEAQTASVNTQLDNARQYVSALLQQAQTDVAAGRGSEAVDFKEQFEVDPERAVSDLFQARIGPIYNDYLNSQAVTAKELAREKLSRRAEGDRWTDYEKEIEHEMSNLSPEAKARPDVYERVFELVRSRHVDDIINRRIEERTTAEKQAQTERASPPKGRTQEAKTLSPEEKRIAELLGVPEDAYMKSKAEHEAAGGFWRGNAGVVER